MRGASSFSLIQAYSFMKPFLIAALWLLVTPLALAQERFSIFVGSAQENVDRMVKLAELKDDDVVIDLGSGDGRIVITAARTNSRLKGWGVDIDEKLVRESNAEAKKLGMAERVQFFQRDVFDADISGASVITMWMWPEMQRMLRTKILAEAKPGTRVLTPIWGMGDAWKPDRVDTQDSAAIHLWIVPARVAGYWSWDLNVVGVRRSYSAVLEQNFQNAEGVVRVENRRGVLEKMVLRGADIQFTLGMTIGNSGFVTHTFSGKVQGDEIVGTVKMQRTVNEESVTVESPWRATRAVTTTYFSPTGDSPTRPEPPAKKP
jgi:Methyltransferase domain